MKKLSDNITMTNAYCEITDCRDIESCEKCVELNIAEHDKQIRAEAIDEAIHHLDNSKANCHEDYIDGIDFAIGVLSSMAEKLKEQK